jgi:hypothetical protein
MPRIEKVFQRVKQRLPAAFRDDVQPNPPDSSDHAGLESQANQPEISIAAVGEPGFRNPGPANQEIELGEPANISEHLKEKGWEAIAWYLPFHMNGSKWGVYIHWTRFKQLASQVSRNINVSPGTVLAGVYDELIAHELFHSRTEVFATVAEDILGGPLYLPYSDLYEKIRLQKECVEESLATSYGLAKVKNKKIRDELGRLAKEMPESYSQWTQYPYSPALEEWWDGIAKLTGQIVGRDVANSWEISAHLVQTKTLAEVPKYAWFDRDSTPDDVLTYLVQHKDFVKCLQELFRNHVIKLVPVSTSGHPSTLFIDKKKIAWSSNKWDGVPPFIYTQVAQALNVDPSTLRKQVRAFLT